MIYQRLKKYKIWMILSLIFYQSSAFCLPIVSAESAILIDAKSGEILYAKNPHKKMVPASTLKILTGILIIEKGNLGDIVTVSENAATRVSGESAIWLSSGEKISLEDLLYAILVRSANDACVAVAEHIAGSEEKFVEMMNNKAKEIGAFNSHFSNSHGLKGNNYTTAYDLSKIAQYALRNPKFQKVVKTKRKTIPWSGNPWDRVLINRNKLLRMYPYSDGVKTGFTFEAGRCFVASATRQGWQLISVVLKSADIYEDSISLLEYGFDNFKPKVLIDKGVEVKNKRIWFGSPRKLSIITGDKAQIVLRKGGKNPDITSYLRLEKIKLPIKKNEGLGKIIFRDSNNKKVAEIPVVAGGDVKRNWILTIIFYSIIVYLLFYFLDRIRYKVIKNKRRKNLWIQQV